MKLNHLAGAVILLAASTQVPLAVPITGNIGFTGSVIYDTSSPGSATEVTSWVNPIVSPSVPTGTFAGIVLPGQSVTFTSGDWAFADSTTINPFWTVDGFTFQLLNSQVVSQGFSGGKGYVVVFGSGIVSAVGFTPTVMSFDLTSQDPAAGMNTGVDSWSFAASGASVPFGVADGGSTILLMGLALAGVAWMARKNQPVRSLPAY
jgi:hypothetical protein